jgi:hypothetical protein
MPMTSEAAKQYKPRRTPGSLDDVIYPETRAKMQAAKQEAADRKTDAATNAAYNKAVGMKKGGVTRADGCVTKGHTKGKMVKMAYGGKAC